MTDEERLYKDLEGNQITLWQMVRNEPEWAVARIRVCEELEGKQAQEITDDELCAKLSEILVGYREGSAQDIIDRAKALVEIEKQHNRQEAVNELFDQIRVLGELATDIEDGS